MSGTVCHGTSWQTSLLSFCSRLKTLFSLGAALVDFLWYCHYCVHSDICHFDNFYRFLLTCSKLRLDRRESIKSIYSLFCSSSYRYSCGNVCICSSFAVNIQVFHRMSGCHCDWDLLCCHRVQVLHLQKVLMRKRDPVTHVVFIDLLTDAKVCTLAWSEPESWGSVGIP